MRATPLYATRPIKSMVDPKDIAQLAVFLVSDAAKAISGKVVSTDDDQQKASAGMKCAGLAVLKSTCA